MSLDSAEETLCAVIHGNSFWGAHVVVFDVHISTAWHQEGDNVTMSTWWCWPVVEKQGMWMMRSIKAGTEKHVWDWNTSGTETWLGLKHDWDWNMTGTETWLGLKHEIPQVTTLDKSYCTWGPIGDHIRQIPLYLDVFYLWTDDACHNFSSNNNSIVQRFAHLGFFRYTQLN